MAAAGRQRPGDEILVAALGAGMTYRAAAAAGAQTGAQRA